MSVQPFFRRRKSDPFTGDKAPSIDYKDIRLLQRYISERGKLLGERITTAKKEEEQQQQQQKE